MKKFVKSLLLTAMMTLFFGLTTNAAVTSVEITSPTTYASMRIARKATDRDVQIQANVQTTGGSSKALVYSSSNNSVASVNNKGIVTLHRDGKVTITAASAENPAVKDTITFTVVQKVTKVVPSRTTLKIYPKKSWTFKATTYPVNAEKKGVYYYSKNTDVATIKEEGKLTSIKPGSATIVAKALDGAKGTHAPAYAYIQVTVVQPVTGITLHADSTGIYRGSQTTVKATVAPSNAFSKKVTYSSSNPSVATVNEKGVVKAVAPGYATITATAADGCGAQGSVRIQVLDTRANVNTAKVSSGFTMNINGRIYCSNVPALEKQLSALGREVAKIAGLETPLDATVTYNGKNYTLRFNKTDGIKWENSNGESVFKLINGRTFGSVTLAIPGAGADKLQMAIRLLQSCMEELKGTYTFPSFTWSKYTITDLTINRNGSTFYVNGKKYESYLKYNVLYFKGDLRNDEFIQYLERFTGGVLTIRK
ncbi:MAG: Ig-like domain-containing protein [Eubacteriales bacterium]|nr:Ig-like domain-containing protein [Eubacteriales bacterium]